MTELHQERDRLPRTIILVIIASGVAAIVIGVFVAWAITRANPLPQPGAAVLTREEVNEIELTDFEAESAATQQWRKDGDRLSRYGWVDRSQGIVHLPIDTAIEVYLTRRPGTAGAPERTAERPEPGALQGGPTNVEDGP